jgi:probable rRNA maturation factor
METQRIEPAIPSDSASDSIMVEISDVQSHLVVDDALLELLVRTVLGTQRVESASISIALVDDRAIEKINQRHLSHDWPTDVISFDLSDPGDPRLVGELVVSAEMAAQTAREAGTDPRSELALYVIHGMLHLCGLDDQTPEQAAEMRLREAEILASLGLMDVYSLTGLALTGIEGQEGVRWPR